MNEVQRANFERRIRALAEFGHRGSTTEQERAAADYLCDQMRSIGLEPKQESFTGSSSFGGRLLVHIIIAALGGALFWVFPLAGILIDTIVLISLWAENTARGVWLSWPVVRRPSINVCAWIRTPAPRLRVIVSGHYDTQRTGLVWHLAKYYIPMLWWLPSVFKPPLLSLGFAIFGQAILSILTIAYGMTSTLSTLNWLILAIYLVAIMILGQWSLGAFVTGAADNASGTAAVLAIAESWRENPVEAVEVVVLLPSCEESGLLGAAAWVDQHREELSATPTIFVNLDNLGVGPVRFLTAAMPLFGWPVAYPHELVQIASEVAEQSGLADTQPHTMPGPSDGLAFLARGLRGLTIVSFKKWGYMPWYHLPGDTVAHLDFDAAWQGALFGWKFLTNVAERKKVSVAFATDGVTPAVVDPNSILEP